MGGINIQSSIVGDPDTLLPGNGNFQEPKSAQLEGLLIRRVTLRVGRTGKVRHHLIRLARHAISDI